MNVSSTYSRPAQLSTLEEELRLLEQGEAVVDLSANGIFRLEGNDAVDFLQRISTNDLKELRRGQSAQTVLTTEKGRVIDSVVVHHRGDFLLVITSKGAKKQVQRWLEKYIIMEDVKIVDPGGMGILLVQMNSGAVGDSLVSSREIFSFRAEYFGKVATFYYGDRDTGLGEIHAKEVGGEAFDLYCLNNGIIQSVPEVLGDFNPLELNLWDQISFTKGCYIGQEVIARLETYKKVQRTLCRIRTEHEFHTNPNHRLTFQQRELGILLNDGFKKTPSGRWVALTVIRKEYAIPGAAYMPDNGRQSVFIDHIFERSKTGNGNDRNNR